MEQIVKISKDEVQQALKRMKNEQAVGLADIWVEV